MIPTTTRRGFLTRTLSGVCGLSTTGFVAAQDYEALADRVNVQGRASHLRITDLRYTELTDLPMRRVPILRIDTNQGIQGLGEVRDGASPNYALMLKSRLLGENPCDVDRIFRKIKQFGGHGRQGGGVSGVEIALWDLVGKAYDVPVYQLLGGKHRQRVRLYADTPTPRPGEHFTERMRERKEMGFTVLKMDLSVRQIQHLPDVISRPLGSRPNEMVEHMFTGWELTHQGIDELTAIVAQVRETIGWEIPLAADHFGRIGVNSCIRLGKALEQYNMAWLEDMVPWQRMDLLKQITQSVDIPTLTGEDIYLKEPFEQLMNTSSVDMIHPDLCSAGGLLETKKIADLADEAGVAMAIHCGGSPIAFIASVHLGAAIANLHSLEFHSADVSCWEDLVSGIDKPIVNRGWTTVPEGPGLGIELNDEVMKQHLLPGSGYFEPTHEWDERDSHDRNWS